MNDLTDMDPKSKAILAAAWEAFSAYGFRKTSMDDIARAAGMSRPALYLHYRNKEAIVRSLTQFYYDDAAVCARRALSEPGTVQDQLSRAFAAQGGAIIETLLTSPHGLELLDANAAAAADIVEEGEAALREVYRAWLEEAGAAGRVTLTVPADETAAAIAAALKGIKAAARGYPDYQRNIATLGVLFGQGLSA